jgi:hypothetical protein
LKLILILLKGLVRFLVQIQSQQRIILFKCQISILIPFRSLIFFQLWFFISFLLESAFFTTVWSWLARRLFKERLIIDLINLSEHFWLNFVRIFCKTSFNQDWLDFFDIQLLNLIVKLLQNLVYSVCLKFFDLLVVFSQNFYYSPIEIFLRFGFFTFQLAIYFLQIIQKFLSFFHIIFFQDWANFFAVQFPLK